MEAQVSGSPEHCRRADRNRRPAARLTGGAGLSAASMGSGAPIALYGVRSGLPGRFRLRNRSPDRRDALGQLFVLLGELKQVRAELALRLIGGHVPQFLRACPVTLSFVGIRAGRPLNIHFEREPLLALNPRKRRSRVLARSSRSFAMSTSCGDSGV
jgi:hypothetical protein